MDFSPDYVYYVYPNTGTLDLCQTRAVKQNHFCGNVYVKGTVYLGNPTIAVNPALYTDAVNSDCGCCNDRYHRIAGDLVVYGQLTVGNTVIVDNVSIIAASCCPVLTETVCGDLLITNNLRVTGTIVAL